MPTIVLLSFAYTIVAFSSTFINGHLIRHKREVCQSEECQAVSDYILSKLDTSVDPCQDMYRFSCGRWPDMSKVGKHVDKYTHFHEVENNINQQLFQILQEEGSTFRCKNSSAIRKLKDLYRSCVNFELTESRTVMSIIELIDSYGSWTVTKSRQPWYEENWSLQQALSNAHRIWGKSLWTVTVTHNKTNANIFFQQSRNEVPEDFIKTAIDFVELLGGDKEIVKDKMSKVMDLEIKLAEIDILLDSSEDSDNINRWMSLGEFQKILGSWIDMEDYLEDLFGVRKVTLDDEVLVENSYYFSKLNKIIQETSKETIANYVMWDLIMGARKNLPVKKNSNAETSLSNLAETEENKGCSDGVEESSGDGDETYTNGPNENPRQKECLERAKKSLPFLTSALFVDKNLSIETINKIVTAIDDIEHEFIKELQVIEWLDDTTRKIIIEKAKSMSNKVGYPDWILNPDKLDAKYETIVTNENDFLKNIIHIQEFDRKNELNRYFRSPEIQEWLSPPEEVDASYTMEDNEMTIYAGILQSPLVSPYYPRSYLYGGIGTVLGHELVHGFDNEGRLYTKHGIYEDTWTPHVAEEFNKMAQCFVDQYSSYTFYNMSLNGENTLGENIADNGGMKISYRAYQSSINPHDFSLPGLDFTDDQLFFLGMSQTWCGYFSKEGAREQIHSDPHATGKFRVIGTLSNSKEFAEVFKCERNAPMNPETKCVLW